MNDDGKASDIAESRRLRRLRGWLSLGVLVLVIAAGYLWLALESTTAVFMPNSSVHVRSGPVLFTIGALITAQLALRASFREMWSRQ